MGVAEKVRDADPQTSWDAAAKADLADSQRVVLDILHTDGPRSHEQIYRAHVFGSWTFAPYSESRIRTATKELVDKGLVVADGTKLNGRGRHETLWRLT